MVPIPRCIHGICAVTALFLSGLVSGCASARLQADLVIENVTVYAGDDRGAFVADVAVADGRFVAVDTSGRSRAVAGHTLDGSGLYMMPGLWDMHVHVRSSPDRGLDVREFLDYGVTSVRDIGGYGERVRAVQRDMAAAAAGPTIHSTYETLNGEAFAPFQRAVLTAEDAARAVDELAAQGAAQVKVHRALAPELFPVLIGLAHERGLSVTGHIPLGVEPLAACESGVDGIEHVGSFLEAYVALAPGRTPAAAIDYLLSDDADALYDCLA